MKYNQPQSSRYHNSELIDDISSDIMAMSSSSCPFLIVGDMNGKTGTQIDYNIQKKSHFQA